MSGAERARTALTTAPGSTAEALPPPARRAALQGCYADLDGLAGTLDVLRRSAG